ncbi:nucleotidyltransferase family protein [Desulfonatronospira sp.]|uniref:nucleotidyltransferase family protein n=1 Tax=Desulfonatronospira sp. TaxID=1962951 RepID=UPI0025BD400F|nr:nucleotidyltransferase family protein [Desulfonatronospira sp.]
MLSPQPLSDPSETREAPRLLAALVTRRLLPSEVPSGQWQGITETALAQGLAPMLFWAVRSSGMDPESIENGSAIAASARQAALADILMEEAVKNVSRAFSSARIPAVWLKGAALARTVYPQSCLRPMGDLDVLVPFDQREQALETLFTLGYELDTRSILPQVDPAVLEKRKGRDEVYAKKLCVHHFVLKGGRSDKVLLELHFGLRCHNNSLLLPEKHMQGFFQHTRSLLLDDQTSITVLLPEAHLPYLAVHSIVQHGGEGASLMRDLDMHLLITKNDLHWPAVIHQAAALGWTGAVYRALERAVESFATPVPPWVLEELVHRRPDHEDPFMIEKRHSPGYRWVVARNTLARLPVREKMRFIAERLFPYADFMRARYAVPQDRAVWPYYPYRWFDQGRVIGHAIARRIRAPKGKKP